MTFGGVVVGTVLLAAAGAAAMCVRVIRRAIAPAPSETLAHRCAYCFYRLRPADASLAHSATVLCTECGRSLPPASVLPPGRGPGSPPSLADLRLALGILTGIGVLAIGLIPLTFLSEVRIGRTDGIVVLNPIVTPPAAYTVRVEAHTEFRDPGKIVTGTVSLALLPGPGSSGLSEQRILVDAGAATVVASTLDGVVAGARLDPAMIDQMFRDSGLAAVRPRYADEALVCAGMIQLPMTAPGVCNNELFMLPLATTFNRTSGGFSASDRYFCRVGAARFPRDWMPIGFAVCTLPLGAACGLITRRFERQFAAARAVDAASRGEA